MARSDAPLPSPFLVPWGEVPCPGCGYDLAGLGDAAHCPECGVRLGPERVLCLVGVPRRAESNPWRRLVWGVLIAAAVVLSQAWAPVIFAGGALALLLVVVVLLLAVAGMVLTGRGGRRSTEVLTFGRAGIGRRDWVRAAHEAHDGRAGRNRRAGQASSPQELLPWPEAVTVRVEPVGAVWQKLEIRVAGEHTGGRGRLLFACGFRCERERGPWVRAAIEAMQAGVPVPDEAQRTEPDAPARGLSS